MMGTFKTQLEQAVRTDTKTAASIFFNLRLANTSGHESRFVTTAVGWMYQPGIQESIAYGDVLAPVADINVDLPLDVSGWDSRMTPEVEDVPLTPPLSVPAGSDSYPGYAEARLQLHYSFTGALYHPQYDWNIVFRVELVDVDGNRLEVVPVSSWRGALDRITEAHQRAVAALAHG